MKHVVVTDLEGPTGVDSFAVTRDAGSQSKGPAMDRLAVEVNACIEGIREADLDASVSVWDLHGSGGLDPSAVRDGIYRRDGDYFADVADADTLSFVGQHAMAGMPFAPLRHTYSSQDIASYRLNGTFVGEFACRALVAGRHGVPTVFIAGDDKACLEARLFVPEIETVATKYGTGVESARHRDGETVRAAITAGAREAVDRRDAIAPLDGFDPPYELEVRYQRPVADHGIDGDVDRIDDRTIVVHGRDLTDPTDALYRLF